ncbi:hypothetical protein [Novosphingobium sp.]|uniref:hypothetical protein n=1 Tax=Novosphingobium sp. TaxID=1874826 RepID=UPI0025D9D28A|nr:hypothetical protein [Novosphingobium sp.]
MGSQFIRMFKSGSLAFLVGAIAASICVTSPAMAGKKKPAPPPPPPPRQIYVAWKPVTPEYASPLLAYPALGADGLRVSVNRNISPAQTVWNLRSGLNVAALNCRDPGHADILVNYRNLLKTHAKGLRAANLKVDSEWRAKYGPGFVRPREKYMTEVYNHYAIPPVKPAFCNAALAVSNEMKTVKPVDLTAFATRSLPSLEIVFDDFFKRFDKYHSDMAAWEARWGKDAVPGTLVLETPQNAGT